LRSSVRTAARPGRGIGEEGADRSHALGSSRTYINVSTGFHCEEGRAANGEPLIVCDVCDEIQPD
jgi:hypothetical protein